MTELHAGYRVPNQELDEIPMNNHNSRTQNSRPSGAYQKRLDSQNYWNYVIEHRLAVVLTVLAAAIVIGLIGISTYLIITPGKNYTNIEINKITEVENPVTEESGAKLLEDVIEEKIPFLKIPEEPFDDMLGNLIDDTHKFIPLAAYEVGRTKRMKREVEEATVESCKERHENCKVLLHEVKNMTEEVSQRVHQLRKLINKIGIQNEQLPSVGNVTILDFAACLRCEKLENQTTSFNVTDQTESDNPVIYIKNDQELINNITGPLRAAEAEIKLVEGFIPPEIAHSEKISNVTYRNISVVQNPDESTTVQYLKNATVALNLTSEKLDDSSNNKTFPEVVNIETSNSPLDVTNSRKTNPESKMNNEDDLSCHHSVLNENPGSNFEQFKATDNPENTAQSIPESITGDQSYSPESKANAEQTPFFVPTGETSKGSLQVTYTPNVGWMPYPLCIYGPPNPPPQSPILPAQPIMQPPQQGFQFVQPGSVPVLPQRYGPTGPPTSFYPANQGYHQPNPTGQARPIYCTYLPTPTFQFPVVPGVSEFQRAVPESKSDLEPTDINELDQSDEQELKSKDYKAGCPMNSRACTDHSRCIPKSRWCDGEVDCKDASDESRCSCRDRVDKDRLCDGYFDCPLGEDELGCFGCDKHSFSCDDSDHRKRWGNCVRLAQRCDGYPDCENGKDEMNCNIITRSVDEREMFTVGYTTGYLHRNWQGKWYPACTASNSWADNACRDEIGDENYRGSPTVETIYLQQNYNGPYVVESNSNEIKIVESCSNKAVFVNCPRMPCGTRVSSRHSNPLFDINYSERHPSNGFQQVFSDFLGNHKSQESKLDKESVGKSSALEILRSLDAPNTTNDNEAILGDSRVVGGHPSQPKAWPSLVALNRDGIFHCGGVILDEMWVLTAAHCIDGYTQHYYDIQAGILRRFSYSPMEQSRKIVNIVMHPAYDKESMKNDLALLRLEASLNFNRWVRPACLPEMMTAGPSWRTGPPAASTCVSAGWGSIVEHGPDPDHLREVELPILPKCKHLEDQNEAEICAGTIQGGRDTCQGDSGGPLMCRNPSSPSQWYVAGIVSHGEGCARPNEPGAYTKVSRFVEWINRIRDLEQLPHRRPLQRCPGYYCHSGSRRCYPSKRRCDKTVDCMDAEDELNCHKFTDFTLFKSADPEASNNVEKDNNNTESTVVPSSTEPSTTSESLITSTETMITQSRVSHYEEKTTTIKPVEIITTVTMSATTESSERTEQTDNTSRKIDYSLRNTTTNQPIEYFSCKILMQTIDLNKRCNKVVDCEDGTDEENCNCKDYLIKISPASICDGHIDCRDGTDEENCEICSPDQFHCKRSRECIPMEKRCDIKGDCEYNEDELGCLTLTNGKYVITDIDGMPHHNSEGILTTYNNGKWVPFCMDRRSNRPATLGKQMCSYFGYVGCESYNETRVHNVPLNVLASSAKNIIPYENSSLYISPDDEEPRCTALYIRCLPTIHTVSLAYKLKGIPGNEDDTFLWPWHAAIFVDGRYKCSAVLLEPSWLLTNIHCTNNLNLTKNYMTALLGVSRSYLQVDGPHQQMSQVDEIKTVKNSDAVLLHLRYPTNMTRHVQPMYLQKRTHAPAESDTCVTVGVDNDEKTRSVFLKAVLHNCPDNRRCYKTVKHEKCENETINAWSGTVVCFGCCGWYPAAVYHEENGLCSFTTKRNLSSIDYINTNLITGMQEPLKPILHEPKCNGFRCPLGECIESRKACDGVPDCRDGADEEVNYCREIEDHCVNGVHDRKDCHCARSELRCNNGQCVPKSAYCDGKYDCFDKSDEPLKCDCVSYLRLTAPEKICDGRRHCFDKTDENPNLCMCKDSSFKCNRNGDLCVPEDFVCDGQPDCPSGDDENQCLTLTHLSSDPPGYGEIIQRSYGVWHSRCFPGGALTENELSISNLCNSLGYSYAKNFTESDNVSRINLPAVPKLEKFYVVRLNSKAWIVMRDDKEFVTLHPPSETCYRHYVTCV